MYSPRTKLKAIAAVDKLGISKASQKYKVPVKSLKRWLTGMNLFGTDFGSCCFHEFNLILSRSREKTWWR